MPHIVIENIIRKKPLPPRQNEELYVLFFCFYWCRGIKYLMYDKLPQKTRGRIGLCMCLVQHRCEVDRLEHGICAYMLCSHVHVIWQFSRREIFLRREFIGFNVSAKLRISIRPTGLINVLSYQQFNIILLTFLVSQRVTYHVAV